MTDDQTKIQEGEIVSDSAVTENSIVGMINSLVDQIALRKNQLAKFREMFDDFFLNDSTYQEHNRLVKEAVKVRSATKKQILKQPQVADLDNQIKELRSQIKELDTDLSSYLADYAKSTGATTIETTDGVVRQIVYTAKLIKVGS